MRHVQIHPGYFLAFLCALLMACATGGGAARPFENYAGDVLAGTNEVVTLTRTLLAAKKISSADAENVVKAAEVAQQGVAVARTIAVSDGPAGTARLRVAAETIAQLQTYLLTRK